MTYWKPEPKRHGFAWWALLIPAIIYSAGVVIYAHAVFVPGAIQANGHEIGSAMMVFGGEAGTLMAAAEVFRKWQIKQTNILDWLGMAVSLVATLGDLLVVYTALCTLTEAWVYQVRAYGPLVLLLCSGLDFYANVMEFGFYNASFDKRWETWNDAKHTWEQGRETSKINSVKPEQPIALPKLDLTSLSKSERVHLLAHEEPELSQAAIAVKAGCSEGYVSRVLRSNGKDQS